ncbi:MAG: hypothetical protein NC177_17960 [Ruminococcus flavefaciens]|nr:hypothetical protein [Ruminococcus flavefaciens]
MPNKQQKPKRKTYTSSEVKTRYNKKTYQQYSIKFRIVEDAEIIKLVEDEKSKGFATSEAFKRLILKEK